MLDPATGSTMTAYQTYYCQRCLLPHRTISVDSEGQAWLIFDFEGTVLLTDTDACRARIAGLERKRDADCMMGLCPRAANE